MRDNAPFLGWSSQEGVFVPIYPSVPEGPSSPPHRPVCGTWGEGCLGNCSVHQAGVEKTTLCQGRAAAGEGGKGCPSGGRGGGH